MVFLPGCMAEKPFKRYVFKGPADHFEVAFKDRGGVGTERPSDLCFSTNYLHVLEVLCSKFQPPTAFADVLRACQKCSKLPIGLKQRSTDLNGKKPEFCRNRSKNTGLSHRLLV